MHSGVYLNFIGELAVTWGCPGVAKKRMLGHRGASSLYRIAETLLPFPVSPRGHFRRPISPHFSVGSNIFLSSLPAMNKLFPTLNIWAFSPNGTTAIEAPGTWNDKRKIDLDQRIRFRKREFHQSPFFPLIGPCEFSGSIFNPCYSHASIEFLSMKNRIPFQIIK